MFMFYL